MNNHDVKTLLEAGLRDEPPLRTSVDTAVAAGRRTLVRRRGALAGAGLTAGAAVAALALVTPGADPGTPPSAAADPLVGPLVPAAAGSAAPQTLRPDAFGPGTEHTTRWSSKRLADTLVGLLPPGKATVREETSPAGPTACSGTAAPARWSSSAERSTRPRPRRCRSARASRCRRSHPGRVCRLRATPPRRATARWSNSPTAHGRRP